MQLRLSHYRLTKVKKNVLEHVTLSETKGRYPDEETLRSAQSDKIGL